MARKRTHRETRRQRRERKLDAAVAATTAILTCSRDLAHELDAQCELRDDDVEFDLGYAQLALEIWRPHATEGARALVEVLIELIAELQRHQRAVGALRDRLAELELRDSHEHLEPAEHFAELVYRRLFAADSVARLEAAPDSTTFPRKRGTLVA